MIGPTPTPALRAAETVTADDLDAVRLVTGIAETMGRDRTTVPTAALGRLYDSYLAAEATIAELRGAVTRAERERDRYQAALRYYADEKNWDDEGRIGVYSSWHDDYSGATEHDFDGDNGAVAQIALGRTPAASGPSGVETNE